MIEEPALVVACEDEYALVETQVQAACGSCQAGSGCGTSVLSSLFKRRYNQLRALNPIQAKPGQRVIIGLQEQALVLASLIVYLLPLVCMLLFAIGLQVIAESRQWQGGELSSMLGALAGLVIGFFLVRVFSRRHQRDRSYQAVILRKAPGTPIPFS